MSLLFDEKTAEVFLYGEIGPEFADMVSSKAVIKALAKLKGRRATVRINSPGGAIDEAVAIGSAMERHSGGVDTVIDGLAASSASFIFQMGLTRTVSRNGAMMIHNPWSVAMGNANDMRKTADLLDKYGERIARIYADRSGKHMSEVLRLMEEETWFLQDEIIGNNFGDKIGSHTVDPQMKNLANWSHKIPAALQSGAAARVAPSSASRFPQVEAAKRRQRELAAQREAMETRLRIERWERTKAELRLQRI